MAASSRRPQPRPRPQAATRRPGQPAPGWTTPGAGPFRTSVEGASRSVLVRLHAAPRWAVFLGFLALAVGAGVAPAVIGAVCAGVLALLLAWLLFLAWPKLDPRSRLVRMLVIGVVIGVAVARLATR